MAAEPAASEALCRGGAGRTRPDGPGPGGLRTEGPGGSSVGNGAWEG